MPAPTTTSWLRRRVCDLSGHLSGVALRGPHSHGYQRCQRCARVLGPGR